MTETKKIFLLFVVISWVGCASQKTRPVQFVAQPLVEIQAPAVQYQPSFLRSSDGKLSVMGPTIDGTRGEGLNMASTVHQTFLSLGIPNEVRCNTLASRWAVSQVRSQVMILFPEGLSPDQQTQVQRQLALLQPELLLK